MGRRRRHPGNIERRGNSLRVRLTVNGERHYFTLKTTDRSVAEKFTREKERELRKKAEKSEERRLGLTEERISKMFKRFEDEYVPTVAPNTRAAYKDSLKPFRTFFVDKLGDPFLRRLGTQQIQSFLVWRRVHGPHGKKRKKPLSKRTLEKDRAVLHLIFEQAEKLELRDGNPVANTDRPDPDERDPVILTDEQYERLLEKARQRPMLHLYVLLLGETGVRAESEALWIQWEDVRLEDDFIWISSGRGGHRTKSGKGRWVPMTSRLRAAMRKHFARYRFAQYDDNPTPWVFHHTRTWGKVKAGARIKSFRGAFNKAAERAKLPEGFVRHDLRHRRVTKWLAEEKSPVHVKEAVGHSDLRTTMGYTHLAREHLRSLVEGEEEGSVGEKKKA